MSRDCERRSRSAPTVVGTLGVLGPLGTASAMPGPGGGGHGGRGGSRPRPVTVDGPRGHDPGAGTDDSRGPVPRPAKGEDTHARGGPRPVKVKVFAPEPGDNARAGGFGWLLGM